jgi:hypothetical protein
VNRVISLRGRISSAALASDWAREHRRHSTVDREYLESLAQRVAAELRLPVMLARKRVGQLADVWCRQRPTNKCSAAFPKWKSDQFASNKQWTSPIQHSKTKPPVLKKPGATRT